MHKDTFLLLRGSVDFENAALCVHQSSIKQQFHDYKVSLCSIPPTLSVPNPLASTDLLSIFIVVPFPKRQMSGIRSCVGFLLFGPAPLTQKYAFKAHPFVDGLRAYSFFSGGFKTKQMHWLLSR